MINTARSWLVVVATLLAVASPALADPAEDTVAAFAAEQKGNFAEAFKLYRAAAVQGYAYAQASLGTLYYTGQGTTKDVAEAARWFRKAADQGDASGQYGLGGIYERGDGVKQDAAEAVKWYRLAAAQGNPSAQNSLGVAYASGNGVMPDLVQAQTWFSLAAAQGHEAAKRRRESFAARLTPAQVAQVDKMVREFKPTKPK